MIPPKAILVGALLISLITHGNAQNLTTIYSFIDEKLGSAPADLVFHKDTGFIYGLARSGGANGRGSIFRINRTGTGYATLYSFGTYSSSDGGSPSSLLIGSDNRLYGTTLYGGGPLDGGVVFSISLDGSDYKKIYSFQRGEDGNAPSKLIVGSDGLLYGISGAGYGKIFSLQPNGTGFKTIFSSSGPATGRIGHFIEGTDRRLYICSGDGGYGFGTIFSISRDGTGYTVLKALDGDLEGKSPGNLLQASDGRLYGTLSWSGQYSQGGVFTIGLDGTGFNVLHHFRGGVGGSRPERIIEVAPGLIAGSAQGGEAGMGLVYYLDTRSGLVNIAYSFRTWTSAGSVLTLGIDKSELLGLTYHDSDKGILGGVFRFNYLPLYWPSSVTIASGDRATLQTTFYGTPPISYQWHQGQSGNTASPVTGATSAVLTTPALTTTTSYWVRITDGNGSITNSPTATVTVSATSPLTVTQVTVGTGYAAGGGVIITNTITYSGTAPSRIDWATILPAGWKYLGSGGSEGGARPAYESGDLLEWAWTTVPASPIKFTYTVSVPAGTTGDQVIASLVTSQASGTNYQTMAKPDPLVLRSTSMHTADSNRDGKISLTELTRVIELYNYRSGTTRTGQYKPQAGTEDGFAAGPP